MPRLPDLVRDSRLDTEFRDSLTIHSYPEIDEIGGRFSRKEHWKWERYLGHGGFGQVKLQRCITKVGKPDSVRVVKIMDKKSLDYNRELEAIAKFSNDRYKRWFVKSFGWFEDTTSIFITMEYCRHGDLHHYLKEKRFLPPMEVQQLAYQIVEGLDQMHQNDFAHRDLKPGNILIKSKPPERWWIVLADFGISKRADESNGPTTTIKGTDTFMAPELLGYLDRMTPKSISDFKAADMWALGEVVFQMLVGEATFQNPVEMMRYCTGQREFPSHRLPIPAADDGREFVTRLMMALPQDRITTTQCIRHRWIESLVEDELSTLILEDNNPLAPEKSQKELASASAQWSSESNPEHGPTQTPSQRKLDTAVPINDSTARQTQLQSTSSSIPIQHNQYPDQESLAVTGMKLERTLVGHSARIYNILFSPDGKRLVSSSDDNTVRIWDTGSGELVQTLQFHSRAACDFRFSPDNKRLASLSNNRTVWLWDASSGELVKTLEAYVYYLDAISFSPNSKRLVSCSPNNAAWLWDTESGELVNKLEGCPSGSGDVAFSPDSKRLVLRSNRGTVWLYDAGSGELVRTLDGPSSYSNYSTFSLNGKRLACWYSDYTTRLYDVESGKLIKTLEGSDCWPTFSPDNKLLASAYRDMTWLWDVRSGELMKTLRVHSNQVDRLVFSPDGKQLISSCYDDFTARLWDVRSGELIKTFDYSYWVFSFSSDSKRLVSCHRDAMQLWDARSGELVKTLVGYLDESSVPVFSPDGKQLASYSYEDEALHHGMFRLWDTRFGELLHMIESHSDNPVNFVFSPDSKWLATYTRGRTVQLWLNTY